MNLTVMWILGERILLWGSGNFMTTWINWKAKKEKAVHLLFVTKEDNKTDLPPSPGLCIIIIFWQIKSFHNMSFLYFGLCCIYSISLICKAAMVMIQYITSPFLISLSLHQVHDCTLVLNMRNAVVSATEHQFYRCNLCAWHFEKLLIGWW